MEWSHTASATATYLIIIRTLPFQLLPSQHLQYCHIYITPHCKYIKICHFLYLWWSCWRMAETRDNGHVCLQDVCSLNKTSPYLTAFGVLPKTGDEELEDRGKPGWERLRMICARSTLAWRRQDSALWIDRHGVYSWMRLRPRDMLQRQRERERQRYLTADVLSYFWTVYCLTVHWLIKMCVMCNNV